MTLLAPHQGPTLMTDFDPVADDLERSQALAAELRAFLALTAATVSAVRDMAGDLWWDDPLAEDDPSPAKQELYALRRHNARVRTAINIIEGIAEGADTSPATDSLEDVR